MCLLAIAMDRHPEYPLIIAANRDEFYSRPTAPLSFWDDHPEVLAGRDLQSHGTWLGITRKGRIAALTNFREPGSMPPWGLSRGQLVRDFLIGQALPQGYLAEAEDKKNEYCGFNLVVGDTRRLWWYSNRNGGIREIPSGIHCISNHLLDTPWPKAQKAKTGLARVIDIHKTIDPEMVFTLLFDTEKPPDDRLPDTGVGLVRERMLSSMFVVSEVYGTRSSSVILVHKTGHVLFSERTFTVSQDQPVPQGTKAFEFDLP